MRCASSITCARPARIVPIGAHRPLFRLTATVFTGARELVDGNAERDRGIEEPRAVEVDVGAVALRGARELGRQLRGQDGAAGPRVGVLEHQHRRARLDDRFLHLRRVEPAVLRPERPRLEAGDLLDPPLLGGEHVRRGFEHDGAAPGRDRQERDEVGHPAGRHPERGLLAEQPGHPLLELVDGRVLADRGPAERCLAHGGPHLVRGPGVQVRPEVDHRRSRWRPGRAPVCSEPSTTKTPLTSTCSTPRA